VTFPINLTVTGDLHVHVLDAKPILDRIDALEAHMTQAFGNVGEALDAIQTEEQAEVAALATQRAAFDSLATAVRAFIANLPAPGEVLTAEHAAQAQAIVDSLTTAVAGETTETADEAALQAEVPAPPAPPAA